MTIEVIPRKIFNKIIYYPKCNISVSLLDFCNTEYKRKKSFSENQMKLLKKIGFRIVLTNIYNNYKEMY